MKSKIKIAILTFLLKYSVPGQKDADQDKKEISDLEWLTGLTTGNESQEFIRWFIDEKTIDTESIYERGKKLIQVWVPVQSIQSKRYAFTYIIN